MSDTGRLLDGVPFSERSSRPSGEAAVAVAVGAAAAAVAGVRLLASGPGLDRLWAEDGAVFLSDALRASARSLVTNYAGYQHGVPRLLTLLGAQLPWSWFAAYAVFAALVVTGAAAGYVFTRAHVEIGATWVAVVAAGFLVLAPPLRWESLGTLANLQWFLLAAAAWAAIARRPTRVDALVVFAAAVTTPLAVVFAPALLIVHGRHVLRASTVWALAAGGAVQAIGMLAGPQTPVAGPPRGAVNVVGAPVSAVRQLAGDPTHAVLGALLALLLLAVVVVGARRALADNPARLLAAVATCATFAVVVVTVATEMSPRYVAALLMLAALPVTLALAAASTRVAIVAAALLAVAMLPGFLASPYRTSGSSWQATADTATAQCGTGQPAAPAMVSPAGWGTATLTC